MFRKPKPRRRVNWQELKKYKKVSRSTRRNIFDRLEKLIPKKHVASLYKFSEHLFTSLITICCRLSFIRISVDSQGNLRAGKTIWELVTHYSVLALQMIRMLHIFVATANRALSGIMDLKTFLCVTSLLSYAVGLSMSSSLLFRPHDTVQLLNATPTMLALFPKPGKVTTMFQNAKTSIVVSVLGALTCGMAFVISLFGFLVDQYPAALYYIVESTVGRPQLIPYVGWKLVFWPLELLTYAHTMILASISSMTLLTLPNIMMECSHEIRKVLVNTTESWIEVRQKYFKLQVYVCLVSVWVKFLIVPTIVSVSSFIIIASFITFRYTNIQILIYLAIATVGVSVFVLLFWFNHEVLTFIRSTEAIVRTLNSPHQPYFLELPPQQRLYLTKYGKATRKAGFDIGDFVDYSVEVPISIWEEILNQLVFLFSF